VTEPKKPTAGAWIYKGEFRTPVVARKEGTTESMVLRPEEDEVPRVYDHPSGMRALSAVEYAEGPIGGACLQFHLSVSCAGRRATNQQVQQALRDFDLREAYEDNHSPTAIARHFWQPIDPAVDGRCHCETTEEPVDEGDGYVWRRAPGERL
jgi:hypothetical protein